MKKRIAPSDSLDYFTYISIPISMFWTKKFWGGGFFLKTPPLLPNATALNRQTCHSINRCPKAIGLDYITIYRAQLGKWVCIPDYTLIGLKMNSLIVPTCTHNKTNWHLKTPQHYAYKKFIFPYN